MNTVILASAVARLLGAGDGSIGGLARVPAQHFSSERDV